MKYCIVLKKKKTERKRNGNQKQQKQQQQIRGILASGSRKVLNQTNKSGLMRYACIFTVVLVHRKQGKFL
jgi:hypothetical protein